MSLNIYVGKENFPNNLDIWLDPEKMIYAVNIEENDFNKKVISEIEQGTYLDNRAFLDRFGYKLYLSSISTGSKILIEAYNVKNAAIVADEIGMNAKILLLTLTQGNICFIRPTIFPSGISNIDCTLNGVKVTDSDSLNNLMEERIYAD